MEEDKGFFEEIRDTITGLTSLDEYKRGLDDILFASTQLNKTFLQGRGRIEQMQYALSDAIPTVVRLGGNLDDTLLSMSQIAESSRRNLIANVDTVSELTAANKLLGISVGTLSDSFLDVGVMIDDVGEKLEESIFYVQSIGGNAKQVVTDVVNNMDKLNRYQFEGGVEGLTKMAAQASMLRVDMRETFDFAEKVMTPEGAIEMAAAFQRLGVAAGDLVNPFALMDKSINDPSGLQDSLAKVAQQFVSFSKEQGRFTISREGVLRLREMEEQAGYTRGTLSKMGIAAAEMGERMEQISMAGLTFKNEEDKQFLANITSMGKDGIYQVTLEDNTKVDLTEINQKQFERLLERERDRPKTLEEMQRAQMNTSDVIKSDVRALRDKIVYGVVTMGPIPKVTEEVRSISTAATSAFEKGFDTSDIRNILTDAYKGLEEVFTGDGDLFTRLEKWENTTEDKLGTIDDKFVQYFDKLAENFKSGLRGSSANEMQISELVSNFQNEVLGPLASKMGVPDLKQNMGQGQQPLSSQQNNNQNGIIDPTKIYQIPQYLGQTFIEGQQPLSSQMANMTTPPGATPVTQLSGNFTMTINHTFSPEFSKLKDSEKVKLFNEYLEKQMGNLTFESYLKKLFDKAQPETFPVKR